MHVFFACVWRLWFLCVCQELIAVIWGCPHPWNKLIDLGARHKNRGWHPDTKKCKEKQCWPKSVQLNKKTILFLSDARVSTNPPQRGLSPLHVLCLAFGCQSDCVSCDTSRCMFFCTCMVFVVFVCVRSWLLCFGGALNPWNKVIDLGARNKSRCFSW